ncbi:MAG: hypothetical protein O3B87_01190 [bacterium]|nr:hypothetical protein [bacterium]
MKKILLHISLVFILGVAFVFFKATTTSREKSEISTEVNREENIETIDERVNLRSSFAIVTNGTVRVFTAPMYHELSPDAFITANEPNSIQVTKAGTTWDDFFKTLPFSLSEECLITGTGETFCNEGNNTLKFFLNGNRVEKLLGKEIRNGDKALITYGQESEAQIQNQLQLVVDP